MNDCRIRCIRSVLVHLAERNTLFNRKVNLSSQLWLDIFHILQIKMNCLWRKLCWIIPKKCRTRYSTYLRQYFRINVIHVDRFEMRTECFFKYFRFGESNCNGQCMHGSQVLWNKIHLISNFWRNYFAFTSSILKTVILSKPRNLSPFLNPNGLIFRSTSTAFWSARLAPVSVAEKEEI